MQWLEPPGSAQRFLLAPAAVYNIFNVQRHLVSPRTLRTSRAESIAQRRAAAA
jgi:hypothetical protein